MLACTAPLDLLPRHPPIRARPRASAHSPISVCKRDDLVVGSPRLPRDDAQPLLDLCGALAATTPGRPRPSGERTAAVEAIDVVPTLGTRRGRCAPAARPPPRASVTPCLPTWAITSAMHEGLRLCICPMRSLSSVRASSGVQPPPTTGQSTMGISFNAASHISSTHHGRVRTLFVARTTRTSDL